MRRFATIVLSFVALSAPLPLHASACNAKQGAPRVDGLPVDHYIEDVPLHRRWAVVVDCAHPDRPWTLRAVPWLSDARTARLRQAHSGEAKKSIPLVPAGAKVRLWHMADGARIDLSGTALDAGGAGQLIHVRTRPRGAVLQGRVRAEGSVELLAADKWQNKGPESLPDEWKAQ